MADPAQRRHKPTAAWQTEAAAEVERTVALPGPAERSRADTQLPTMPRDDGETLPVEAEDRISQTLRAAGNATGHPAPGTHAGADRARRAARWGTERKRRTAAVRVLRPWIGPACFLAAALPFVAAPVGWGWSAGRAAGFLLLRPAGTLGVALAILGATAAALLAHRRNTLDGLLACASGALIAGVAGFAVARGLVGF